MARITSKFIDFGTGSQQVNAENIPVIRTPINYTPTQEASEGVDKISAHLYGIDLAINKNYVASVMTGDDTVTLLQSITPDVNQLVYFESKILAVRTGGVLGTDGDSAAFVRSGKLKNYGGVVGIGTIQSNYSSTEQTTWSVNCTTNSTSLLINVMGAPDNDITWQVTTNIFILNFS